MTLITWSLLFVILFFKVSFAENTESEDEGVRYSGENCPFSFRLCQEKCRNLGDFGGKCEDTECKCHDNCKKYKDVFDEDDESVRQKCLVWCINKEREPQYNNARCAHESGTCICTRTKLPDQE
ncbi:hypothetical protein ScPMuIL_008370 [Solemya velum]